MTKEDLTCGAFMIGMCLLMLLFVVLLINSEVAIITPERMVSEQKYTNVVRIFMHTQSEISFLVSEDQELKHHTIRGGDVNIKYFTDVPETENSWILEQTFNKRRRKDIEVHMHSPKEIEGGKWHRGGYPSGSSGITKVIE